MNTSKRVTYCFLILLYCVSLLLRYPVINGPHDSDSFVIQGMALKFTAHGLIPWLLSIRSYFGMYPFSYPSAVPILLASLTQITGLDSEISILFLCLIFSIVGINNMFLFSRNLGNNFFSLLCVLSFSTSFYFLNYTFWTIAVRGLFLVMVPLFLHVLIKLINFQYRYLFLSFAIYFLLLSTHRSHAYVFIVFIFPYFIMKLSNYFNYIDIRRRLNKSHLLKYFYAFIIPIPFLISLYYIEFYDYFGIPVTMNWIVERYEGVFLSPILNYAFRQVGENTLSSFSILGFFSLVLKKHYDPKYFFITLTLLFSSAFLVDYEYFLPTILPIISLLAGYGMFNVIKKIKYERLSPIFIIILLFLVSSYSTFHINQINTTISADKNNPPELEGYGLHQETRNNANWIEYYIGSNNTVIDGYYHSEHASLINMSTLRQVDLVSNSPEYVDYLVVEEFSLFDVFFNQRNIYYGGTVNTISDSQIYHSSVIHDIYYTEAIGSSIDHDYLEIFEVSYVIEPASGEKWFLDVPELNIFKTDTPPFFIKLYEEKYMIYSNEKSNIYSFDEHKQ